ncbi:hypothetical protein QLH32_04575 [Acinetobacter corruptisaponis]|uniref:Uncharacterized protein n=1 Tax=Acinetobacter corruptisaponis TaxID=3045147 RepID=A0ABY8S5U1_9GAMM|nr:hypothetical protein [Acinetobacter sp. KCTC 92772]WHP06751.1 hypothetical protein QLH32_04575 [Acinetobacter sp. KCTC 92772]
MITFSNAVINDRLLALTRALDANSNPGKLLIYGGTAPVAGQSTSETLLCELTFPKPSAGNYSNKTLAINNPNPALALASGTVTWARLVDGSNAWVADCNAGGQGSNAVVQVQNENGELYAGGNVTVTLAQIAEV